jgi:prevent-host-death family protein
MTRPPCPQTQKAALDPSRFSWPNVAMKSIKIADLKDHLSEHLRAVERGAELEVTDRSRPIAHIVPVPTAPESLKLTPPKVPFASLRGKRRTRAKWTVSSLELLEEERDEG